MLRTLGVSWVGIELRELADVAADSERVGFEVIGHPDSQTSVYRDVYVALSVIAQHTRTCRIASIVTNPLTRRVAVTASAMSSLRELAGGERVIVGLGTGDSAPASLGLPPARLSDLETCVAQLREMWSDSPALEQTEAGVLGSWARGAMPVYLAAMGPKALRLAGRVADGAIVSSDMHPERIAWTQEQLKVGAADARRALPPTFQVWKVVPVSIEDEHDLALDIAKPSLAAAANIQYRGGWDGKFVPDHLKGRIRALQDGYDVSVHSQIRADNPNASLLDRLGLTAPLAERLAIIGDASYCAERIAALVDLGVQCLVIRPLTDNPHRFLERWEEVSRRLHAGGSLPPTVPSG